MVGSQFEFVARAKLQFNKIYTHKKLESLELRSPKDFNRRFRISAHHALDGLVEVQVCTLVAPPFRRLFVTFHHE